jgi:hypothetical protein
LRLASTGRQLVVASCAPQSLVRFLGLGQSLNRRAASVEQREPSGRLPSIGAFNPKDAVEPLASLSESWDATVARVGHRYKLL